MAEGDAGPDAGVGVAHLFDRLTRVRGVRKTAMAKSSQSRMNRFIAGSSISGGLALCGGPSL
jgi:hypothetical protein